MFITSIFFSDFLSLGPELHFGFLPAGCVLPVNPNLKQNEEINANLESAADHELQRGFAEIEISRLEDVSASPHKYHLNAGRRMRSEKRD